jgi:phage shock protein E
VDHGTGGTLVLDVRSPAEFAGGAVQGALNLPLAGLALRIGELVPVRDAPIALYCASGARSAMGCQLLQRLGYTNAVNLGGVAQAAGLLQHSVA